MAAETELERLVVRLVGDSSAYLKMLHEAQAETKKAAADVEAAANRIEGFSSSLGGFARNALSSVTALAGGISALGLVTKSLQMAGDFEENEIAFGTMLSSMEKGKELNQELAKLGAQTPLNLPDLQRGAKALLQFGVHADNVVGTLRQLGDASMGNAENLQRMVRAFGQMRGGGKFVQADELNQMVEAGFAPFEEIAKNLKKTVPEVMKMRKEGEITFQMVADALRSATSEGGRFFNAMQNSSKGIKGLFSTLQDDIGGTLRQIGMDIAESLMLRDAMKGVSKFAQELTGEIKQLPPWLKTTAAWVAAATTALLTLGGAAMAVAAAGPPVIAAIVGTTKAVVGLTVALATNPFFLIAAAASAAAIAAAFLTREIYNSSQAVKDYNAAVAESDKLQKQIDARRTKSISQVFERVNAAEAPDQKAKVLAEEIKHAEAEMRGFKNQAAQSGLSLKNAKDEVSTIRALAMAGFAGGGLFFDMTQAKNLEGFVKEIAEAEKGTEQWKEALSKLREELKKVEAEADFGKVNKAIDSAEKKLKEQIATWGLSAEAATIAKLKTEGATESQLGTLRILQEELKRKQQLEREGLDELDKAIEQQNKWADAGKKLTEDVMTPLEKLEKKFNDYLELLDEGAITQETFDRAMKKADEEFEKSEKSAKKATHEIQRFDHALVGSAESAARIAEFSSRNVFDPSRRKSATGPSNGMTPAENKRDLDAGAGGKENVEVLKDIRDILKEKNPGLGNIEIANLA